LGNHTSEEVTASLEKASLGGTRYLLSVVGQMAVAGVSSESLWVLEGQNPWKEATESDLTL
jgi:hypothetical protein